MVSDLDSIKSVAPRQAQAPIPVQQRGTVAEIRATQEPMSLQAREAAEEKPSLDDVVSDLNTLVRELHRELHFSVDQESGSTVIKVIDRETDEVVRQIPSEELVRLRQRLEEAAGVIFQDSA